MCYPNGVPDSDTSQWGNALRNVIPPAVKPYTSPPPPPAAPPAATAPSPAAASTAAPSTSPISAQFAGGLGGGVPIYGNPGASNPTTGSRSSVTVA